MAKERAIKVLMFGWEFPPHISGGLGTACFGLTTGLSKHKVEVLFVVPKVFGDENTSQLSLIGASDTPLELTEEHRDLLLKQLTILGIESYMLPYISPQHYETITHGLGTEEGPLTQSRFTTKFEFTGKYGQDLINEVYRFAAVAEKISTENSFDVIHAHDWLTYPAGILAKQITNKPLVVHVHATEFDRSGEHINQAVFNIEQKGMLAADKVITVSNLTREIVINRYGIAPDKVVTVHNAVLPKQRFLMDETKGVKEKIVTFLGRVTFQKGPEYFIEAAHKVLQKDENVRFVMAGSGDMLNRMIRRVAQLRIGSKFHFTGFLKGKEVTKMLEMSDAYVMPSVSEPFGISPLEAMRSNVPVIISKQSGVAEILKHAIKVDFWDIDAIADAIYGLLHYKALSGMFAHYGEQEVEDLKWENAAVKVKNIYESTILPL